MRRTLTSLYRWPWHCTTNISFALLLVVLFLRLLALLLLIILSSFSFNAMMLKKGRVSQTVCYAVKKTVHEEENKSFTESTEKCSEEWGGWAFLTKTKRELALSKFADNILLICEMSVYLLPLPLFLLFIFSFPFKAHTHTYTHKRDKKASTFHHHLPLFFVLVIFNIIFFPIHIHPCSWNSLQTEKCT